MNLTIAIAMEESCIYSCKVTREDTGGTETYTGLAGGTFKSRFYGHKARSTTGLGAQMARAPHYPSIYGTSKIAVYPLTPNGVF